MNFPEQDMGRSLNEDNLIARILGTSKIQYQVMDQLMVSVNILQYDRMIFHLDAYAIFGKLYHQVSQSDIESASIDDSIRQMVISFMNILAHYRWYFAARMKMDNMIFIHWNMELPDYQKGLYPNFMETRYEKFDRKHPSYSYINRIVQIALKYIISLVQYFEGIYFIPNRDISGAALVYLTREHYSDDRTLNVIFSKSLLYAQLIDNTTVQIISRNTNSGRCLTRYTVVQDGILANRKTHVRYGIDPAYILWIQMLGGCKDCDMPATEYGQSLMNSAKVISIMDKQGIITPDLSVQGFLQLLVKEYPDTTLQVTELYNRYRALSARISCKAMTKSQLAKFASGIIDLYDQNAMEQINEKLADISIKSSLLQLTFLNAASGTNELLLPFDNSGDYQIKATTNKYAYMGF